MEDYTVLSLATRIQRRFLLDWKKSEPLKLVSKNDVHIYTGNKNKNKIAKRKNRKAIVGKKKLQIEKDIKEKNSSKVQREGDGYKVILEFSKYPEHERDRVWSFNNEGQKVIVKDNKKMSRFDKMLSEEIAKWAYENNLQVSVSSDGGSMI